MSAFAGNNVRPGPDAPFAVRPPYDAVIFDLDGVVTDTAAIHAQAWKRLFDDVLADPRAASAGAQAPFDIAEDYRRFVDGRTREDGVRAFLASRHLELPESTDDDPPGAWSVSGLAARKNDIFLRLLTERGAQVFPGTESLLHRLRDAAVPIGLVTSSRNAAPLLAAAGIADFFGVVVDGTTARDLNLAGKPDPALFLEASTRLGVTPRRAAIIEDAVAGVQAGRAGTFGLVVGIARQGNRAALEAAGADLVLDDVSQLDLGALRREPWTVTYEGFDPTHEGHREALTTLANGYLGTRGAAPESRADGVHYPGTYLAGVYNRLTTKVDGAEIEDEQIVNAPNWLPVDLRIEDGDWWSAGGLTVERERTDLDLRLGVLVRQALLSDRKGRSLRLSQRRIVSMARPHVAALATAIVAEGWTGSVTLRSGIDASVTNSNVPDLRALANRHLTQITGEQVEPTVLLVEAETTTSGVRIATAIQTTLSGGHTDLPRYVEPVPGFHALEQVVEVADGRAVVIEKTAAIVTSRDSAVASPAAGALAELARTPDGFDILLAEHESAWAQLWDRFEIQVTELGTQDRLVLNLHLFHLMQTLTRHTAQLDAGIPARGLHGEGYRGHVFWDELFVLPILTTQAPGVARALLDYRWRRLPEARHAAARLGLSGALFPWQSGSDGREETPDRLYNPRSGRWMPDNSQRQRHVGLAVAFNAWQYYVATGDLTWLAERGGELIIEVARVFDSMSSYDADTDRFHIDGVMGPDEYHDGYPDAPGPGLRDNAYTNIMVAWVCGRALDVVRLLRGQACDELMSALSVDPDEPAHWEWLRRRLAVPFHDGLISQFDGYDALEELDWPRYRARYGNIGRLDLILESEGDSTNRYKLAKQADVLMLVYLLGIPQLIDLLAELGYPCVESDIIRTIEYYLARTAHGSTLSRVVHASVLARVDGQRAWSLFRKALVADLDDTQGGTTNEGVHLGAMAGTIDILRRAYAGLHLTTTELTLVPRLPHGVRALAFRVHYRGHHVQVRVDHDGVELASHDCETPQPLAASVGGSTVLIRPGQTRHFT